MTESLFSMHSRHPNQPVNAQLLQRLGPEILDIILAHSHNPVPLDDSAFTSKKAAKWARRSCRKSDVLRWSRVCRVLSVHAARVIWRIIVIQADIDVRRVQKTIMAAGGPDGRVGSSVRGIYSTIGWTKDPAAILQLVSLCPGLRHLDAPLNNLGFQFAAPIPRLQTLVLLGDTQRKEWKFELRDLAELHALKHLTIDCRVQMPVDGPAPAFSLISLTWLGRFKEPAVRWTLQQSQHSLQVLMIHMPTAPFLYECLHRHGATLQSIRLHLIGSIGHTQYEELLETVGEHCPQLREFLSDLDVDPSLLWRLPASIQHIALNPRKKSSLFKHGVTRNWVEGRPHSTRLTLWGDHARRIFQRSTVNLEHGNTHIVQSTETMITRRSFGNPEREFQVVIAPVSVGAHNLINYWPFSDEDRHDYISPVIADHRCR